MKIFKLNLLIVAFFFALSSCEDIEDLFDGPSIEKEKVVLMSPSDSTVSQNYIQTFLWEKVDDAKDYKLEIVEGRFNSVIKFVLDTVVKQPKVIYALKAGNFQWRVVARNKSSETKASTYSFTVVKDSIVDFIPELLIPVPEQATTTGAIQIVWKKVAGANWYRVRVDTIPNNTINSPFYQRIVGFQNDEQDTINTIYTLKTKGTYYFSVRAERDSATYSQWSRPGSYIYK